MSQALDTNTFHFTTPLPGRPYSFHFIDEEMEPGDAGSVSSPQRRVVEDLGAVQEAGHGRGVMPKLCVWLRPLGM